MPQFLISLLLIFQLSVGQTFGFATPQKTHAVAGGLASELSGGSFADGALAAGLAEAAGPLVGATNLSPAQQVNLQRLIATAAVLIRNDGDADGASFAAGVAASADQYNRQLHQNEVNWIEAEAEAFAEWMCETNGQCDLSRTDAIGILAAETLDGVSDSYGAYGGPGRRANHSEEARAFITQNYDGPAVVAGQHMFGQLSRRSTEYRSTLINVEVALNNLAVYQYATEQSLWLLGQSASLAFIHEGIADYAERPDSPQAEAFVAALASDPTRARQVAKEYAQSSFMADPRAAFAFGRANLLGALPDAARQAVAEGFAEGRTGRTDLSDAEIERELLNGNWSSFLDVALEEALAGELIGKGFSVRTLANGRRVFEGPDGQQYRSLDKARAAAATNRLPCPSCFVEGTPIKTANGHTNIEDVKVGDFILAKDVVSGRIMPKRVSQVHIRPIVDMNSFFALTVSNGTDSEVLRVTGEHPFWAEDQKQWVEVDDLEVGDTLIDHDGKAIKLVAKTSIPKFEQTYNLTVEDFHTYFAGKLETLVHNCGPNKPLNWSGRDPAGLSRREHVKLHGQDDLTKPLHGIFNGNPLHTVQQAWKKAKDLNITGTVQGNRVVYDVPFPNAGTQGGYNGSGGVLNTVRIVTERGNNRVITGFPN